MDARYDAAGPEGIVPDGDGQTLKVPLTRGTRGVSSTETGSRMGVARGWGAMLAGTALPPG